MCCYVDDDCTSIRMFPNLISWIYRTHTYDDSMTVLWLLIVILDGHLIWIICISLYMGDYIEKLDNTFIYPPHPIPKPNQYNNKYYCQYGAFFFCRYDFGDWSVKWIYSDRTCRISSGCIGRNGLRIFWDDDDRLA